MQYEELMALALAEARRAGEGGEVPIGAVVALDGAVVGRGFNHPIGAPVSSVPEPSSAALFCTIAGALGLWRLARHSRP